MLPSELHQFARIAANAYPGMNAVSDDDRSRMVGRWQLALQRDPRLSLHGFFGADDDLLGGLRLHDFTMQLHGARLPAVGLASLAIDLARKKEHVARDLMVYALARARGRGVPLALLYPFRPDFYRSMGFGYGPKLHEYRIRPTSLPAGAKDNVRLLDREDTDALAACYARYLQAHNGLLERAGFDWQVMFDRPDNRLAGYWDGTELRGYLVFSLKPTRTDNWLLNDMHVREVVYEDGAAMAGLLAFLASQDDQCQRIVLDTFDEDLHYLLADPRDGSEHLIPSLYHQCHVSGLGLMYRVIDVPAFFRALSGHKFGGQSLRLRLTLTDTFFPQNAGSTVIEFREGRANLPAEPGHDVELRIDVSEFSSMVVGAVDFTPLLRYGLVELSDQAYAEPLQCVFHSEQKPICFTAF